MYIIALMCKTLNNIFAFIAVKIKYHVFCSRTITNNLWFIIARGVVRRHTYSDFGFCYKKNRWVSTVIYFRKSPGLRSTRILWRYNIFTRLSIVRREAFGRSCKLVDRRTLDSQTVANRRPVIFVNTFLKKLVGGRHAILGTRAVRTTLSVSPSPPPSSGLGGLTVIRSDTIRGAASTI